MMVGSEGPEQVGEVRGTGLVPLFWLTGLDVMGGGGHMGPEVDPASPRHPTDGKGKKNTNMLLHMVPCTQHRVHLYPKKGFSEDS